MTLELPELLEIEWDNYADRINNIYDIYLNEIYEKLSLFGKPVHCRIIPIYDNKHECFWHLMTQDFEKRKTDGERFPDLQRCRRIHWIAKIITNYQSSDIVCWVKQHRRKIGRKSLVEDRIYLWAKKYNFVVILGKQKKPEGYQLITSYCTNDPDTIYRFEKQCCEYPDPRKS